MVDEIKISDMLNRTLEAMNQKDSRPQKSGKTKENQKRGLNIDQFGLSDEAKSKIVFAQAQFEVNYQALRSMNSANGFETSETTFSFKGSLEFLQMASGQVEAPGNENIESGENSQAGEVETTEGAEEQNQLSALEEYFSPENTAQRILDVATSFFAMSEIGKKNGDNEDGRQKFADFIGAAIETGFKQAKNILGDLPEAISGKIEKTHEFVFSGLNDFVKNGIDPEKSMDGGVFDKIAAYRVELNQKTNQIYSKTTGTYNSSGKIGG